MMPNKEVHVTRWKVVFAFILLTLSFVLAIALVSREAKQRSDENHKLILLQQQQRAEITYTTCLDQNERHDRTIIRLDTILKKAVAENPAVEKRIKENRASTVFLIEALAPHQNCKQIVTDRFGFVPVLKDGPDAPFEQIKP